VLFTAPANKPRARVVKPALGSLYCPYFYFFLKRENLEEERRSMSFPTFVEQYLPTSPPPTKPGPVQRYEQSMQHRKCEEARLDIRIRDDG
jgi:hypothetical protein